MAIENEQLVGDALRSGFSWGDSNVSYSIPVTDSVWGYHGEPDQSGYGVLSDKQAERFRDAINAWDEVVDLDFHEVAEPTETGQVRIAFSDVGSIEAGHAYYPVIDPVAGDIWLDDALKSSDFADGSHNYGTMLHEIGHTLGLKHPHEASGNSDAIMPAEFDNIQYSIMSYNEHAGRYQLDFYISDDLHLTYDINSIYPKTPMVLDILAAQATYGAEMTTRTGDDVYRWKSGEAFLETIWDAGGNDTIDASNQVASIIDLNAGEFSSIGKTSYDLLKQQLTGQYKKSPASWIEQQIDRFAVDDSLYIGKDNLAIAYGVTIENAIGGNGDDQLIGNEADNVLTAGRGNDLFIASKGSDRLDGGEGYDIAQYAMSFQDGVDLISQGDNWQVTFFETGETDQLLNVESVKFDNITFFDSLEARQVYRLYQAAFDRTPDKGGLEYWISEYIVQYDLNVIANGFVNSEEFNSLYAAGDEAFLYGLYQNVLNRAPDSGGLSYWQSELEQGMPKHNVLVAFSESAENQNNLAPVIDDGFWLA